MSRRTAIATSLILTAFLSWLGFTAYEQRQIIAGLIPQATVVQPGFYRVTEVYDGDTFAVDMAGTPEKIRLIGVDTPETHKPGAPVQCFGPQASDFTKQLLADQQVRLEADAIGTNRDRYDRLLRYAYLPDGSLLNQRLITEGYGFAYLTFPFQKQAEFAQSQAQATSGGRGLWGNGCTTKENNGRWQTNNL